MKMKMFRRSRSGFTLIEIMVVVIVLGILAAIVIPNLAGKTDEARVAKAKSDISDLTGLVEAFRLDMRRYPTQEEGLDVLRVPPNSEDADKWHGPYLRKDVPKDPWGQPYIYSSPAANGVDEYGIESLGRDKVVGGEGLDADINSWTNNEETQK